MKIKVWREWDLHLPKDFTVDDINEYLREALGGLEAARMRWAPMEKEDVERLHTSVYQIDWPQS